MTGVPELPKPTWFIGCGNMGHAVIDGWRGAGIDVGSVVVVRPSAAPVEGCRTVATLAEAGPPPKLVVLPVKPQKLDEVAAQLKPWLTSKTVLISLLAGVEAASLRERFPGVSTIVRAIPNLPVAIRRGVTGLYSADADETDRENLGSLFVTLGFAMWMADEAKLGALGAVAGAGPAYAARFIAALTKAGVQRGLSEQIAATIALETVLGTAWMAATTGEDMMSVARRVASPNGTTEAGLRLLDHDQTLDTLISETIAAAARRGAELAAEAKGPSLAAGERVH